MKRICKIAACVLALTMAVSLTACGKGKTVKDGTRPTVAARSELKAAMDMIEKVTPALEFADKKMSLDSENVQSAAYTSKDNYINQLPTEIQLEGKTNVKLISTTVQKLLDNGWKCVNETMPDELGTRADANYEYADDFTLNGKMASFEYINLDNKTRPAADCVIENVSLVFGEETYPNPSDFLYDSKISSKSSYQDVVKKLGRPKELTINADSGQTVINVSYQGKAIINDIQYVVSFGLDYRFDAKKSTTTMNRMLLHMTEVL